MSVVGSWTIDTLGLHATIILGAWLQAAGTSLRVLGGFMDIEHEVSLTVLGQFIAATAMPFFINTPPLLSKTWFDTQERTTATAISVNANACGVAFVYLVAPLIVTSPAKTFEWNIIMAGACLAFAVVATGIFGFFQAPHRDSVPQQRCPDDEHDDGVEPEAKGYDWHQWVVAVRKKGFIITVFAFSVSECVLNGMSALLNKMLHPEGFSTRDIGFCGALFILMGLISSYFTCRIIDQRGNHGFVLNVCLGATVLSFSLYRFALYIPGQWDTFLALMLVGASVGPLQSILVELGVECAFPVSEATVSAIQQLCGNLLSSILVPAMSVLHRNFTEGKTAAQKSAWGVPLYASPDVQMGLMMLIVWVVFQFYDGDNLRSKSESRSNLRSQSESNISNSKFTPSPRKCEEMTHLIV
jgi:FLVCR family MFS transporter 7